MSEPSGSALARATLARLRDRISSGEWPVGTRLPTEPELSEQLGVGRSTVREAVRSLATLGMVETQVSRGTFVRSIAPSTSLLVDAVAPYSVGELVGARRALAVEAAQSAAARRTDDDLAGLERLLHAEMRAAREAAPRAEPIVPPVCSAFHAAIAAASGNRLLVDLETVLTGAVDASAAGDPMLAADPAIRLAEHDRIFTAIRSRDVGVAAHEMAVHMDAALRLLHHSPIVTDLTTLLRGAAPAARAVSR